MPSYSETSMNNLATCHWVIRKLMNRVIDFKDNSIRCGYRNEVEQNEAYVDGSSSKMFPESKHNVYPSMAVDVTPFPLPENWGDLTEEDPKKRDQQWKERVKFYELLDVIRYEWARMCAESPEIAAQFILRCGDDWDGDGDYRNNKFDDLVHVEIVEKNK